MWQEKLRFEGRRAVVTGGGSGIGAATVSALRELGAAVDVLDVRPPDGDEHAVAVDLRSRSSIDAALSRIEGPVDVIVNCAGMPQTFPYRDVLACNFAGLRHLTESLVPSIAAGGAIVNVSSIVGRGWRKQRDVLGTLLATPDMDAALRWIDEHTDLGDPYIASKMAVSLYTVTRAPQLAAQGIRMNAVCPGNTTTGMSKDFEEAGGPEVLERMSSVAGRPAVPEDQADPIVFLASTAARYVNGVLLDVDGGFSAALESRALTTR